MKSSNSVISRSIFAFAQTFLFALLALAVSGCARPEDPHITGERAYREKNYAVAAGAFSTIVHEEPRDYEAYCHLGASYQQMHAYQEAIQAFKAGLDVQLVTAVGRADYEFRIKLMDGLAGSIAAGDPHGQEIDALERKARANQDAETYFILAKIARFKGDPDAAIDYYSRAALLDNKNTYILKEAGLYFEQIPGQRPKSETMLRAAYVLTPADKEVCDALRRLGVVPGPSLKNKEDLARPLIPKGPIPELDMVRIRASLGMGGDNDKSAPAVAPAPPSAGPTAATPHD